MNTGNIIFQTQNFNGGGRAVAGVALLAALIAIAPSQASAQAFESLGTRALGMGGAFVAVADDATATYWNPAGVATGPTFNLLLDWSVTDSGADRNDRIDEATHASNGSAQMVSLAVPALGLSYYRLRTTAIRPGSSATVPAGAAVDSLVTHQISATFVQTLIEGLVVGTTAKVVRGLVAGGQVRGEQVGTVLDRGAELDGLSSTEFDLDLGAMYAFGAGRLGLVVRNLREPEFDDPTAADSTLKLERQVRVGAAFTPGRHGAAPGAMTTVALDVDITRLSQVDGERRNLAIGAEQWLAGRRLGIRGGFRLNTLQTTTRAGSVGVSLAPRRGTYLDAQFTGGTRESDRSWSAGLRMTF